MVAGKKILVAATRESLQRGTSGCQPGRRVVKDNQSKTMKITLCG
jgi:hypothetical protein